MFYFLNPFFQLIHVTNHVMSLSICPNNVNIAQTTKIKTPVNKTPLATEIKCLVLIFVHQGKLFQIQKEQYEKLSEF